MMYAISGIRLASTVIARSTTPHRQPKEVFGMDHRMAVIIAVLTALAIVAFWKAVIKYLIVVAATSVIAAFGYVLIIAMQNVHYIAR